MSQETGFDSTSFQTYLNQVAPNKIIDETYFSSFKAVPNPPVSPVAVPVTAPEAPLTTVTLVAPAISVDFTNSETGGTTTFAPKNQKSDGQRDYLAEAIEHTGRAALSEAEVKVLSPVAAASAPKSTDIDLNDRTAATAAAVRARALLAQESLLANPSELRKMFKDSLPDFDLNHDKLLDLSEINMGLESSKIESQQNFLAILKKGYNEFRMTSRADEFEKGVNEYSFEVIEKAMDRSIYADPIYGRKAMEKIGSDFIKGVSAGMIAGKGADKKTALMAAGAGGLLNVGFGQGWEWLWHATTGNNDEYDKAQDKYKAFVAHYRTAKDPVPATSTSSFFGKW